ncbi:solute carrier family 49 member 4 [Halyomorpha halys]|uniref:solute carrier family 49 member 4 n=1 Tax=Halyomorpha halys TaxID=286706 RepID=UPI0006D4CA18|nr:disrupted in renal carcinoma protein 2 homolog [Halyomorpha halys]
MKPTGAKRSKSLCLSLNLHVSENESDFENLFEGDLTNRTLKTKSADPRRWWVLTIYGSAAIAQVVIWNTWSPIANSALYAYPSWNSSTIALLNNWGCITFLVFIVPCCWFLNTKGLKPSFTFATAMSTIGSGIRLIPVDDQYFTLLAHLGAIFNAVGGVSLSPAILLLSSTWFPPQERTTATGVGTTMSSFGIAVSYILGPTVVSELTVKETTIEEIHYHRRIMRHEITLLCLIGFVAELLLLFIVIFLFPERPSQPPSRSSILKNLQPAEGMSSALKELMKKGNFWILALSASMCSGITGPWLSLLTIIFANTGITQNETASLGFWTIVCSCCLALSVSKVSDFCPRRIRCILLGLIAMADVMFFWILLITTHVLKFVKETLALTVITGLSLVWAAPPLFYEFGAEITYPISEGIIGGCMMALNNAVACCVYLQLYIFPNINVSWMNYALAYFGLISFILLFFVKDEYNRLDVDRG